MKTILFPTDYSPASSAALRYAIAFARQAQATLVVVYVQPPSVPPVGTIQLAPATMEEQEDLAARLSQVAGAESAELSYRVVRLRGDPAEEIVGLARKEHADLIVMAASGRSGWRRVLMGSVAESVVRHAPCPVLTLKEPAAEHP